MRHTEWKLQIKAGHRWSRHGCHRTGGIYDISNIDRLGKSEVELVQVLVDGVNLLVDMEKAPERGRSIDNLIPE